MPDSPSIQGWPERRDENLTFEEESPYQVDLIFVHMINALHCLELIQSQKTKSNDMLFFAQKNME